MALTPTFHREPIDAVPGAPASFTLRLHNDGVARREVVLEPAGDLAEHVTLAPTTATMESNEIADVVVTVLVPATLRPGAHQVDVHITSRAVAAADGAPLTPTSADAGEESDDRTVSASLGVAALTAFVTELVPELSRGRSSGRHLVRVVNAGNVDIGVELRPEVADESIGVTITSDALTVSAGETVDAAVRVTPANRYWTGPNRPHEFVVHSTASDGSAEELRGTYVQRPRVLNWLGPALAGAGLALLCGTIIWFAFLRSWVEDTADDAAADAIEEDRAALQLRIDELETAAAEAEELPLGTPTDLVLSVAPDAGSAEDASDDVRPGQQLAVTDVIFQNPTGAVGTVSLLRGDDVLLQSELANFRDYDLHLVAPFLFVESEEIVLEVDCRTAGAGQTECPVTATILGFLDEAG